MEGPALGGVERLDGREFLNMTLYDDSICFVDQGLVLFGQTNVDAV